MLQQKLVTVFFQEPPRSPANRETVHEHLEPYLSRGWRIVQIYPGPSSATATPGSTGSLTVLLDQPDPLDQSWTLTDKYRYTSHQ